MKIFKNCWFLLDFGVRFLKILKLWGAPPPSPELPTNAYDNIFVNYWHNFFTKNSIRLLKKFEKSQKFDYNYPKIAGFH